MKKFFLLLFAVVSFTAYKKDGASIDPQPTTSLADKFVGTYTLSSFTPTPTPR